MQSFIYEALPSRVVFGAGALDQLGAEIERLRLTKVLILSTPHHRQVSEDVAAALGARSAGVYDQVVMHVPLEAAQAAREEAVKRGAQGCVALGGGSTVGLGKAIALAYGLPIIAVPTTYAGSEMTPIYGLTENRLKRTGRDVRVLPRTVIYDPQFSLSLPADISACSGMNAMAHAIEALYAEDANPIVSLMAEDSIRALAEALPTIVDDPQDRQARGRALYGAWLAGICLGSVGMAIHHKLCHTLGGTFNLPHAQSHAVLLPYSVNYNRDAARPALERAARALGGSQAEEVGGLLYALNRRIGVPTSLAEIGFPPEGPAETARIACSNPYYNPRPFEADAIQALLERARAGMPPA